MLGWQEVILIFALLLLVFGPAKLPKIARELGKAMREFNKATSEFQAEINEVNSDLTKTIRPSSTGAFRSPLKTVDKWKRDKGLSDIAKKLDVTAEGKTNEQITQEIIEKIESKQEQASKTKTVKG